tara:strand:+ start:300 stop:569 length:270 start_codon:yes stop_codon:yes gene_type:complete
MAKIAKFPSETKKYTYQEWGKMDFDWSNYYKLDESIHSYFFRYDNFIKGLENDHIIKSTFGKKHLLDIKDEIEWWFDKCIGAYNKIEYE